MLERTRRAVETIKEELAWYRTKLEGEGKLLEAQRLHQRTMFDLEMIREIGYCHGIENYARHLTGRAPGEPPPTLLDYLPDDALVVVDESHQTIPQIRGMYHGDRSRKEVLVAYGFRLPKELVLFFKNLLYLNGLSATLAPDLNLLGEIDPIFQYFAAKYEQEMSSFND